MSTTKQNISITSEQSFLDWVDYQICWHDKKSIIYKRIFTIIKILIFLSTGSITIISALSSTQNIISHNNTIIIVVLATIITFLETLLQFFQFEKLYLLYRSTSEKLIQEKVKFQTLPFCGKKKKTFEAFVVNCQALLLINNITWYSLKEKTKSND